MKRRRFSFSRFLVVQASVLAAFGVAYAGMSHDSSRRLHQTLTGRIACPVVTVPRQEPLRIGPLYDDPEVVSDAELAAVLKQIQPRFAAGELKPNFVEHALRVWGVDAKFADPDVLSGRELRDFLIDHGRYLASWGGKTRPLLEDRQTGVAVRWGEERGASVHHDHWLASLTEAGINLDEPVFTPSRRGLTINDVLQQALCDFRLDEREVEWSVMAFGLWLPPVKTWTAADGREMSFDRLAGRLMRGHQRFGVCAGTHRVYSLVVLVRLDDEFQILSSKVRNDIAGHLQSIRELIVASQFAAGYWPSNWWDGAKAVEKPKDEPDYQKVIATGHHLEWLAIAPTEFHPPREHIRRASRWLVRHTTAQPPEEILDKYTYYSHVGNALALWRGVRPAEFAHRHMATGEP